MSIEMIVIGGTEVEVHRKKIKNLHIGVYPPDGRVRVAVPESVGIDAIRTSVLTRMSWIRRKQAQFVGQERQSPRRYVSGETHFLFGRPLRLVVSEWDKKVHRISKMGANRLKLAVPRCSDHEQRRCWMTNWYKAQLRKAAEPRISAWSARIGVAPERWGIRPMKTKWGSCNSEKRIVWLNAALARKSEEAIDYVIVHEIAHLISPKHDPAFLAILDKEMPNWRQVRRELNSLPLDAWA